MLSRQEFIVSALRNLDRYEVLDAHDLVSGAGLLRKHAGFKLLICDVTLLRDPQTCPTRLESCRLIRRFFSSRVSLIRRSCAMVRYVRE